MAIEQKERYIIQMKDGAGATILAESFSECIRLFGEENIEMMKKLDYEEPSEEE